MAWATISLMPCGFSVKAFLADSAVCLQKLFLDFFLKLPPIMEAKNSNTEFPSLPWARCGHVTWLQPMIRRSLPGVSGGKNCVCVCVCMCETSWELTDISFPLFPVWNVEVPSRAGAAMLGCDGKKSQQKNRKITRAKITQLCCQTVRPLPKMLHCLNVCCGVLWELELNTFLTGMVCQCLAEGGLWGTSMWEHGSQKLILERTKGVGSQKPGEWVDKNVPLAIFLLGFSQFFLSQIPLNLTF